jgi:hypothetical protein
LKIHLGYLLPFRLVDTFASKAWIKKLKIAWTRTKSQQSQKRHKRQANAYLTIAG